MKQKLVRKLKLLMKRESQCNSENEHGSRVKFIKFVYEIKYDLIINLNTQFNELSY
jgi:hypothetical protein